MIPFEFATSRRILFGNGVFSRVPDEAAARGTRVFLVTGNTPRHSSILLEQMKDRGLETMDFQAGGEPTLELLDKAISQALGFDPDVVIGLGGGSAVDLGKAVAALLPNPGPVTDFLEVIGKALPLKNPSLPYLAVPTTSGTGAEATRNAVLKSAKHKVKVSLRDHSMLPEIAVVDPELTLGLPLSITAATGLDALTQLMEAYVSVRANPVTDGFCREGILRAAKSLETACLSPFNKTARENMSLAALLSGMALANAGLGAVHGIAGPLGGMCDLSHGLICARLLPRVVQVNYSLLKKREKISPYLLRFEELAQWITGSSSISGLVEWIEALLEKTGLTASAAILPKDLSITRLAEASRRASSMKTNPVSLDENQLESIIRTVFRIEEG